VHTKPDGLKSSDPKVFETGFAIEEGHGSINAGAIPIGILKFRRLFFLPSSGQGKRFGIMEESIPISNKGT
jgi:hypothetical protein